jgi:hypothetical protein
VAAYDEIIVDAANDSSNDASAFPAMKCRIDIRTGCQISKIDLREGRAHPAPLVRLSTCCNSDLLHSDDWFSARKNSTVSLQARTDCEGMPAAHLMRPLARRCCVRNRSEQRVRSTFRRRYKIESRGHIDQSGQGLGPHLLHHLAPVCLHGRFADTEFAADLLI